MKTLLTIVMTLFLSMQAQAETYGFDAITSNGAYTSWGETYLSVDVNDEGAGNVSFLFKNTAPTSDISVTDIYFSNNPVYFDERAGIVSMEESAGVSFTEGATPGSLPSGNTWNWGISADSDSPVALEGINSGETLKLILALASGVSFTDVLNGLDSGSFAIGIHVQAFADGSSESYVSTSAVPVPAAVWLFGSALLGLVGVSGRKNKVAQDLMA